MHIKLISASAVVTAAMLLILTLSNYNGLIANYNVDRYIEGRVQKIDVYALCEIETPAVPAMIRLAEYWEDVKPPEDAYDYTYLVSALKNIKTDLDENTGITSFSIPSAVAQSKLADYFEE